MKIAPQQNNQPNFTSVNLIQVSKKAFANSEDLKAVRNSFINASNKVAGELPSGLSNILTVLGLGKQTNKLITYLESPLYVNITKDCKTSGKRNLSQFSQHLGVQIAEPLDNDYHSFHILTKEHKNQFFDLLKGKNRPDLKKNITTIMEKNFPKLTNVPIETRMENYVKKIAWLRAKFNHVFIQEIEKFTAGEPVHKFVINDLKELPEVFKKIDY